MYVCVNIANHWFAANTEDGFCPYPECRGIGYLIKRTALSSSGALEFERGNEHSLGVRARKDDAEAAKWYLLAAELGHAQAQCQFGYCCFFGLGVPKNEEAAGQWYELAAKQDVGAAQCALAVQYAFGRGKPQDDKAAVHWYRQAASKGIPNAQFALGLHYSYGRGVQKDERQALLWFQMAARQGHQDADFEIDRIEAILMREKLQNSQPNQPSKNPVTHSHGSKAYSNETSDSPTSGTVIRIGPRKGASSIKKLQPANSVESQFKLGLRFANGEGVPKNSIEAVKWFRMAAEQGHANSQFKLAMHYANGEGVPKDGAESLRWIERAAQQGHTAAQKFLQRKPGFLSAFLSWFSRKEK